MPRPNLRKSPDLSKRDSPDLSKPSESSFDLSKKNLLSPSQGNPFEAARKTGESLTNIQVGVTRELGTVAGITIEARAKVDLESLLPAQGISVSRDESKNTLSIGAGIGAIRGKLGVNIGAEMGFEPDGSVSLKSASGGVNVAGFGVEGKAGQSGSGGLALTGFGITLDIARDEKGGISGGVSIQLPGGELGIGFQPGVEQKEIIVEPELIIPPSERDDVPAPPPPLGTPPQINTMTPDELIPPEEGDETFGDETFEDNTNLLQGNGIAYVLVCGLAVSTSYTQGVYHYLYGYFDTGQTTITTSKASVKGGGLVNNRLPNGNIDISTVYFKADYILRRVTTGTKPEYPVIYDRYNYGAIASIEYVRTPYRSFSLAGCTVWSSNGNFAYKSLSSRSVYPEDFLGSGGLGTQGFLFRGPQDAIANWIRQENKKPANNVSNISEKSINRYQVCQVIPLDPQVKLSPQLPNHPQQIKPMDCCQEIKEIHKYLGIAKLKKNKFPVSNAFLVPGGKGNDNCIDYYAITQALFRMLANGLILNPKSKPLGSEWQNINATAWAGQMYEMMAESMSDGNSSQRFEVAAIMQLVQIMSAVAETGRKVEFVADAIGIEPQPVSEELPVCFTVHESHKGFGDSKPKKLKTSGLKTDEQVEEVLGKMLKPSKIPIVKWQFKPGQISINEALKNNG